MKTIFLAVILLLTQLTFAQTSAVRKNQFNLENGIALSGYDPVSYFQKKPTKGSKAYTVTHEGITYQFSSAANAETFKKTPAAYEPQYGGWCAYAMGANGEKVEINPDTYKIVNGKLYLFYNRLFNNTLPDWNKDEVNLKAKADKNWMRISGH
ncbi:YHS domain-containing (seleno)protein [Runella sp.]|uniref:YHS domain-containing (seleno)protein n=1 Tax=Runella sp. TaxID=1960881 RepID=UPI003D137C74